MRDNDSSIFTGSEAEPFDDWNATLFEAARRTPSLLLGRGAAAVAAAAVMASGLAAAPAAQAAGCLDNPKACVVAKPQPGPAVVYVERTFQVDRYTPRTKAQARVVASLDDDLRLKYREDRALWGASRSQIVTVVVPAKATPVQVLREINKATNRSVGDIAITEDLYQVRAGRAQVMAWELGRGATAKAPFGKTGKVAQTYFGRSL